MVLLSAVPLPINSHFTRFFSMLKHCGEMDNHLALVENLSGTRRNTHLSLSYGACHVLVGQLSGGVLS